MKNVQFLRALMVVLFTAPRQALGAHQSCNVTQVQECYSTILDNVVGVLSSHKPDRSLHQNLCTKYGTKSQCEADAVPCLASFAAVKDMEALYSSIRQEACVDRTFTLLRSIAPTAKCSPLPLIVNCVKTQQLQFDKSTERTKEACTCGARMQLDGNNGVKRQLEAGLHRCLIAPNLTCPNHRRRATLARKTLATLLESRGCDSSSAGTAYVEDSTDVEKCWYKQLKRCNERQIKEIRAKMTKLIAKNMLPHERSIAGICRRTRQTCHQHSRVESCVTREQDAIRQLEEAMDEAQALLCKDDSALLKNLLLSYKWWDIDHFTKCSTDIQVTSITDFLYNRIRIRSDCRVLTSRLFRCLEESYADADEAEPKPNVEGARKVLAIFLDRMNCIEDGHLPPDDEATSGSDDTNDDDYPAADTGGNETDINDSAMPAVFRDAESVAASPETQKWGLAVLVSLIIVLAQG